MNAVVLAVIVMLVLSVFRVHVVLSLLIGALAGGLMAHMPLKEILSAFETGLAGGANIALSYVMLGAFAMAIAYSGLPQTLADFIIKKIDQSQANKITMVKYIIFLVLTLIAMSSQNIIPIHIAFIPLIIPPLLGVFNRLNIDRRLIACILTFGLCTTYMFLPYGFGEIFLKQILLGNIAKASASIGHPFDVDSINIIGIMTIPALGMLAGLLIAVFFTYRKPRHYEQVNIVSAMSEEGDKPRSQTYNNIVAVIAILLCLFIQLRFDSLLLGAMIGFTAFVAFGVIHWRKVDNIFNDGLKMMAMIGFVMISAQGFAEVMNKTGEIASLVQASTSLFGGSKALASLAMLLVGLLVTMGIGSSFSTLPIITSIYVPICYSMGFSLPATIALIGAAGALGDAGSPASDSTLGPTAGLNADGQHNHITDSVIPTFIHYNIPLVISGWIASMVL